MFTKSFPGIGHSEMVTYLYPSDSFFEMTVETSSVSVTKPTIIFSHRSGDE